MWIILAGIGVALLIYLLGPILMPFIIAAILAYVGDPAVDWMERHGLSRTWAVILVFVVFTLAAALLAALLLPLLQQQAARLIENLPHYLDWIQARSRTWLTPLLPRGTHLDASGLRTMLAGRLGDAGSIVPQALGWLSRPGMGLVTLVGNTVLVPVVTFYLLRDWDVWTATVERALPRAWLPRVQTFAREADQVLSAFLRGQLMVMITLGGYYSLALHLVGVDLALLIGVTAGLISFVPYLGFIVGLLAAGIAIVVQTDDWSSLLRVVAVFGVGQILEGMVLTPLLLGSRIGLHPVAVIFAVLAGGQLFGFAGVLVALPVAAITAVALRMLHAYWLGTELYRGAGVDALPPAAAQQDEAES